MQALSHLTQQRINAIHSFIFSTWYYLLNILNPSMHYYFLTRIKEYEIHDCRLEKKFGMVPVASKGVA
jgi:hypothetical protein